jgi:uncharacterized protein (DUF362 family)/SAM-dependent methyltransferase
MSSSGKHPVRDVGTGTMFERESMKRFLSKIYSEYHPESVLEAYCNGISGIPCIASRVLAEKGCKVTLVNPDAALLKRAEEYWRSRGITNVEFRVGSLENLPFESDSFDLVWNFAVLPKLEKPMRALQEMRRVSKNLVLVFSNNTLNWGFPFHELFHRRTESEWDHGYRQWMITRNVRNAAKKVGLNVVKTGYVDVPPWADLDKPIGQAVKGILFGKSAAEGSQRRHPPQSGQQSQGTAGKLIMSFARHFEGGLPGFLKPVFAHHVYALSSKGKHAEIRRYVKVALIRHRGDVEKEVQRGTDLIGGLKVESDTIIIKPNLCILDTPESGRTSDIRIVETLLKMLKGSGKRVVIVESGNYDANVDELFKELGYESLAKKYGCELVDLKELPQARIHISNLSFKFPKLLLQKRNYFISIAKLKTHVFSGISCSLKNQWGCISQIEKRPYHPFQDELLYYVNSKIRPDLTIIDGIVGMGGVGPVDGHPIKTNLLLFGKDLIATDSIATKLLSMNPFDVSMLTFAHERGMGEIDPEKIEIVGDDFDKLKHAYDFIPTNAYRLMRLGLKIGRLKGMTRFGMLVFNVGNFMCPRDVHAHGQPSILKILRKSLTSKKWKV